MDTTMTEWKIIDVKTTNIDLSKYVGHKAEIIRLWSRLEMLFGKRIQLEEAIRWWEEMQKKGNKDTTRPKNTKQ